jgi:SNF2 family DNA or RNA helicase
MTRKLKKDHLKELPDKIRSKRPVTQTPYQRKLYDQMADEMLADIKDGVVVLAPNSIAQMTRLRQIAITPSLVGGNSDSGMMTAVLEELESEFLAGNHVVIFTPFNQVMPALEEVGRKAGATQILYVKGGMSANALAKAQNDFQNVPSKHKLLIAQVTMGQSWEATEAATAFFVGYAYEPPTNWQAEDRLHRFGQTKSVNIKYFVGENTIDEHILDILDRKTTWAAMVLDPQKLVHPKPGDYSD